MSAGGLDSYGRISSNDLVWLPAEVEQGNIEYKRHLSTPSPDRLRHLTTQLKWRLREGNGEALYELGVDDDGAPRGLTDAQIVRSRFGESRLIFPQAQSLSHIRQMAAAVQATVSIRNERRGLEGLVLEVLVKEVRDEGPSLLRLAVCGAQDAGKSTLLGTLCTGLLDNGRGQARLHCLQHRHEVESGRTSSVGEQLIGFDSQGRCINWNSLLAATDSSAPPPIAPQDVLERADKLVALFDLAGHEKYLKTTVSGLTGILPDYALMVLSLAVDGALVIPKMAREHLGLLLALKIPPIVVVTKLDLVAATAANHDQWRQDLRSFLPLARLLHFVVPGTEEAALTALTQQHIPIFAVSSVIGHGLASLCRFLGLLQPRIEWARLREGKAEVQIDRVWQVDGVGVVVGGFVLSGQVSSGDNLLLGPDVHGHFQSVTVKSVHAERLAVRAAFAGQRAAFALRRVKRSGLRRGQVLLSAPSEEEKEQGEPKASITFDTECVVIALDSNLALGMEPVVQCLAVRQCAKVVRIAGNVTGGLTTGQRGLVTLQFKFAPEWVHEGQRIVFRQGACKGLGVIVKAHHDAPTHLPPVGLALSQSTSPLNQSLGTPQGLTS